MPDPVYLQTRRLGIRATVVQVTSVSANPETGVRTQTDTLTNVRNVVKEPTAYSRLIRSQATQQDIGSTTFIFWTRDIPSITRLEVEDYIVCGGVKYQVVTSSLEYNSLVITAKEIVGEVPIQEVKLDVNQSMLSDEVSSEVV